MSKASFLLFSLISNSWVKTVALGKVFLVFLIAIIILVWISLVVVAGKFILKVSTRSDSGWCGAQT